MTKKEIDALASTITSLIFEKLENDARVMNGNPEDWIDELIPDEQQISELELLIKYYEQNEDYINAANAFKTLTSLKNIQKNDK